jgi:rhodanese-related sulfurtransferase
MNAHNSVDHGSRHFLLPQKMSTAFVPITISTLPRITPQALATLVLEKPNKIAIIDVRDSDHIGGHIKSSEWIPSNQLDARIPELLRVHRDKEKMVFHCMLSQQRGPSAALKLARAMRDMAEKEGKEQGGRESKRQTQQGEEDEQKKGKMPEVCVLEGGFDVWRTRYGENEKLTEGYVKDLWQD